MSIFDQVADGLAEEPMPIQAFGKVAPLNNQVPSPVKMDIEAIRAHFEPVKAELEALLSAAKALTVADDETDREATALGGQLKQLFKQTEQARKEVVTPHNDFVKAVNGLVKEFQDPMKAAMNNLDGKQVQYAREKRMELQRQEKARQEALAAAQKKLDEEAQKEGLKPVKLDTAPVEPTRPSPVRTEYGSTHIREDWTHEVTIPREVPEEYLLPPAERVDDKKIRRAVKDGIRKIPGVRIFKKETLVRR